MCEVMEEATYVSHHPKKIALIFSAMRQFATELNERGINVKYIKLDDFNNTGNFQVKYNVRSIILNQRA